MYPSYIIASSGKFKSVWDIIIGFLVVYTSVLSPIEIAFKFEGETLNEVYKILDYFIFVFFILDILINFRTTYFDVNLVQHL